MQEKAASRPIGPLWRVWDTLTSQASCRWLGWLTLGTRHIGAALDDSATSRLIRSRIARYSQTRDSDLRHLERYVLDMPNHFGTDLDQLSRVRSSSSSASWVSAASVAARSCPDCMPRQTVAGEPGYPRSRGRTVSSTSPRSSLRESTVPPYLFDCKIERSACTARTGSSR